MESRRVRAAVVLVLAVTAVAVAGASMDVDSGGGGTPGTGEGEGPLAGDTGDELVPMPDVVENSDAHPLVLSLLRGLLAFVVIVLALGAVLALVHYSPRELLETIARWVPLLVGTVVAILALAVGMALLLDLLQSALGTSGETGGLGQGGGVSVGAGEDGNSVSLTLPSIGLLLGLLVAIVVLIVWFSGRSEGDEPSRDPDPGAPTSTSAPAEPPSGRPRPRSGSGPTAAADNEVYRAWLWLADAAGANPRRDTPATVARRARDAGLEDAAVDEITELFEEVRYGGAPVSDERERRATEARSALGGASQ